MEFMFIPFKQMSKSLMYNDLLRKYLSSRTCVFKTNRWYFICFILDIFIQCSRLSMLINGYSDVMSFSVTCLYNNFTWLGHDNNWKYETTFKVCNINVLVSFWSRTIVQFVSFFFYTYNFIDYRAWCFKKQTYFEWPK